MQNRNECTIPTQRNAGLRKLTEQLENRLQNGEQLQQPQVKPNWSKTSWLIGANGKIR